jgi:hypothetical protein
MKKYLQLIVILFATLSFGLSTAAAEPISLCYFQDVRNAPGTAGLCAEYQGLFGLKPLRVVVMAWRLSEGTEQGDNAFAGLELDIVNVSGKYGRLIAGVGFGFVANRDSIVGKNDVATFSARWCGWNDKACLVARHLSSVGFDDRGYNVVGPSFQAWF